MKSKAPGYRQPSVHIAIYVTEQEHYQCDADFGNIKYRAIPDAAHAVIRMLGYIKVMMPSVWTCKIGNVSSWQ